ncbi:ubiquitin recognition factor in ER-associated degradation protein 1-like [Watersipora subatra]|uniref:ubiquitin recognition factor in ER-associated degradation protein 1-like n=1 Tax=Watersipora subatra TaxID=2589382 RepID=UPI00355AED72
MDVYNMLGLPSMRPGVFRRQYRCFSVSFMEGKDRPDVDNGGKIIMPPSALDALTQSNIQYPMLFKLTNSEENKSTHCGVLEFVADQGKIYIPHWMMKNLLLQEGAVVAIESISLPVAQYVKIQPQSVEFLDISNPKAVLEHALRSFACLTVGDIIAINYNDKHYEFNVLELKPRNAVSIIECDMNVEFAPPVGYKEPVYKKAEEKMEEDEVDYSSVKLPQASFQVFGCEGNRLDGRQKKDSPVTTTGSHSLQHQRGIPNYDYQKGKITFIRNGGVKREEDKIEEKAFSPFQGEGKNLKSRNAIKPSSSRQILTAA